MPYLQLIFNKCPEKENKYGKAFITDESKRVVYARSLNYSINCSEWGRFFSITLREKKECTVLLKVNENIHCHSRNPEIIPKPLSMI